MQSIVMHGSAVLLLCELSCRKTSGGKSGLHAKLEAHLQAVQQASGHGMPSLKNEGMHDISKPHKCAACDTCASAQEASNDLKDKLSDKPKEEERRPSKLPRIKDRNPPGSESAKSCAPAFEDDLARGSDFSSPGGFSDADMSEEPDKQESSDMDDRDVFGGVFAIKDKEDTKGGEQDRFSSLPRSASKYVEHFEDEVLKTVPSDLTE